MRGRRILWSRIVVLAGLMVGTGPAARAEEPRNDMPKTPERVERATFAGGCFWCMQSEFDDLDGIVSTTVGYTGGVTANPTYEEVSSGTTGHAEAIEIVYDPARVTYERLLDIFWSNIDPTQLNQQFADVGTQYRTAIFYHDAAQRQLAEASKASLEASGTFPRPLVTDISPASVFYPAEEHHQRYSKKHPLQYKLYRVGSGREAYLQRRRGKPPHGSQTRP